MVKAVLLFLVVMAVLAMFGRLRFPGSKKKLPGKPGALAKPGTCPKCGRFLIGKSGCDCGQKKG